MVFDFLAFSIDIHQLIYSPIIYKRNLLGIKSFYYEYVHATVIIAVQNTVYVILMIILLSPLSKSYKYVNLIQRFITSQHEL